MTKRPLPSPPFGNLLAKWDGQALDDESTSAVNAQLVEKLWLHAWPAIYAAIMDVVHDYEHEGHFEAAEKCLVIRVPDLNDHPDVQWSVALHTNPFVGIYEVEMRGAEVSDAGATF